LLIEALATEIKIRRTELGLTQEALAGSIDLDRPYVTLLEAAKKQPTVSVIWKLAAGLELSPADFMGRVDKRYAKRRRLEAKLAP
jgi:transcriptional regulator with XRE-family HTH domain